MKTRPKLRPMARIKMEDNGRLSIQVWYIGRSGLSTFGIGPGDSLYSRSFRYWKKMAGKQIDLSKCHGSGSGMVGGPKTIRIAWIHSEVCSEGLFRDKTQAEEILREFRQSLKDPLVSYTRDARRQILDYIASAQQFLDGKGKWQLLNSTREACSR